MNEYHVSTGVSRRQTRSLCGAESSNRFKANVDYTLPHAAWDAAVKREIRLDEECIEKLATIRAGYLEEAQKGTGPNQPTGGDEPADILAWMRGQGPIRAELQSRAPASPIASHKTPASPRSAEPTLMADAIEGHLTNTAALERIMNATSDADIDIVFRKLAQQGGNDVQDLGKLQDAAMKRKYTESFGSSAGSSSGVRG